MVVFSIDDRVALRAKLNCTTFDWYMKNVYPELRCVCVCVCVCVLCIYMYAHLSLSLSLSLSSIPNTGDSSFAEIKLGSLCLDTLGQQAGGQVGVYTCHSGGGNQVQEWDLCSVLVHLSSCVSVGMDY